MTAPATPIPSAAETSDAHPPAPVTVLGLGAMGSALVRAFLAAGHPTTVWNRTPGRAEALVAEGAVLASDVRAAVHASPLVVACLLDHTAVHDVLGPAGDDLDGHALVNLTSSTPEESRQTAAWAARHAIAYLDGAIMVPVPVVGTPDALVLYSGSSQVFDTHRSSLAAIAPTSDHLGEDAGLAAIYDLGMLEIFFAGMTGFLHAAALVGADGIDATTFAPYAQQIAALLQPTFAELAADVDSRHYPGDADNVEMELAFAEHIVQASAARGVATDLPELLHTVMRDAVDRGHGRDGFSSVVEVLRNSPAAPS